MGFGVKCVVVVFEIQPDLVCGLLNWLALATAHFGSPPTGAFGKGQKVKYHSISITKSISKTFKPNYVCLLKDDRYKTYQMGFSFDRLGHAQEWDLGYRGVGWRQLVFFRISTRLVCVYFH